MRMIALWQCWLILFHYYILVLQQNSVKEGENNYSYLSACRFQHARDNNDNNLDEPDELSKKRAEAREGTRLPSEIHPVPGRKLVTTIYLWFTWLARSSRPLLKDEAIYMHSRTVIYFEEVLDRAA